MDPRISEAIARNDKHSFVKLVSENEELLEQRTAGTGNTVLHMASRYGHDELVMEIMKRRPLVAAENTKLEIPLHEACRHGHTKVVMILLEADPWTACKLNCENKSAFYMACSNGHLEVVKLLMNKSWLVGLQDAGYDPTYLHVASSRGHTDVVRELLNMNPNLARKLDKNGYSPLHYACNKGNLEITRMILSLDADLALQFNEIGYLPVHLAAMNGKASLFEEFFLMAPISFQYPTKQGETIFHLTVKYNHYDAFLWLVQIFHDDRIFHQRDQYGNTLLHLAVSRGRSKMAECLIKKTDINSQNNEGLTALDILDRAGSMLEFHHIEGILENAGAKRSNNMSPCSLEIEGTDLSPTFEPPNYLTENGMDDLYSGTKHGAQSTQHQAQEINEIQDEYYTTKPEISLNKKTPSPINLQKRKQHLRKRHREELTHIRSNHRNKQKEMYIEAIQNARNTITLVAILIATVTFAAGTNPPGGVYQEGPMRGKSTAGTTTAFKIFKISNGIALFTSLCIVIVLVSILPFQRKQLLIIVTIAHKFMWVSVSFMATAFLAAAWVIMPHHRGTIWVLDALLAISCGAVGTVFVYLGISLANHQLRKMKWRKNKLEKKGLVAAIDGKANSPSSKLDVKVEIHSHSISSNGEGEIKSESTNSDFFSSRSFGFHHF